MKKDELNDETIKAINEGEEMLNNPNSPKYSSIEELKKALDKE